MGTVVLTGLMSGSQGLGLTRMSLPYMLGTMFTPDRDRARLVGFLVHVVNGWLFAFDLRGGLRELAAGHLVAGRPDRAGARGCSCCWPAWRLLPALHPRMASEQHGPTPTRQLEPPGFLALNYGRRTPIAVLLAHLVYGAILGAFYRPKP